VRAAAARVRATEAPVPFTPASLGALVQGNGFTLWHYRTGDTRAAVAGAGYFPVAGTNLKAGDLMVLQAVDQLALVPLRAGPALGTGTTLDLVAAPFNAVRAVSQNFSVSQTVAAVLRTLVLAPLAAISLAGAPIPVSAQVVGPVTQVTFTLRNGAGTVVPPVQTVAVNAGRADATFPAPPLGDGYRVTVADAANPALSVTGNAFSVGGGATGELFRLLLENGALLLAEDGVAIAG